MRINILSFGACFCQLCLLDRSRQTDRRDVPNSAVVLSSNRREICVAIRYREPIYRSSFSGSGFEMMYLRTEQGENSAIVRVGARRDSTQWLNLVIFHSSYYISTLDHFLSSLCRSPRPLRVRKFLKNHHHFGSGDDSRIPDELPMCNKLVDVRSKSSSVLNVLLGPGLGASTSSKMNPSGAVRAIH